MPKNTTIFSPLYFHTGDVTDGLGGEAYSKLSDLAAYIATDDDAECHCIQVTRVVFDHQGRAHTGDASNEAADMIAALYDDPKIPTSNEYFVSPLVSQWTDWAPIPEDPYWRSDRAEHGLSVSQVL